MLNLIHAMDAKKATRFGKYFSTIDFDVATSPSKQTMDWLGKKINIGFLYISGRKYKLTMDQLDTLTIDCQNSKVAGTVLRIDSDEYQLSNFELDHITETLKSAKRVFMTKYRLGI